MNATARFPRPDPAVLLLAALVAAAGPVLHVVLGPPDTFWTIDNGGKALVLASVLEEPARTHVPYAGAAIDPEHRFFPQPLGGSEPYGTLRDGRVTSQYLAPFVYLSVPAAAALGFAGLGVVPGLAGGAAVLLVGVMAAGRAGPRAGRTAAAILAAASPLFFYASVLWEHTLVVALAAAAFLALDRGGGRAAAVAGLCAGAAALFREECALLVPAAAAALVAARRGRDVPALIGGSAVGLVALAAFQKLATGSWTGVHVAVNRPVPFENAAEAVRGLLLDGGASGAPWLVTIGAIALLAAGRARGTAAPTAAGIAVLAAVSFTALVRFPAGPDAALGLIPSNSAAVFLPWALAVPFLAPPAAARDTAAWTAGLFVLLFVLLVPERSITGVHPGPRMLLPALPVAAVLLADRWPRERIVAAAMAAALLASGAWGVQSLRLLAGKRAASGALAAAIAGDPRTVVVTDLFWLPTELSPLWDRKRFHLVTGPDGLAELGGRLAASGERELLLVTAPGAYPAAPLRTVRPDRFPAFGADLHVRPLAAPAGRAPAPVPAPEPGASP